MTRGRPPKPVQIHRLEGTYRPDRHSERAEPVAAGLLAQMQPPAWMTERQREIWGEIIADAPYGILRRIDRQLLVNYVELVARHERAVIAQRQVDDAAETAALLSRNGGISPYLKIINHCVMLMAKLQTEMGFTPTARASLGMASLPTREEPAIEHERFDVILPTGERIPYGARRDD